MKNRKFRFLFIYEFKNLLYNILTTIFGVGLPILLLFSVSSNFESNVPKAFLSEAYTSLFISLSILIPFSIMMISYGAIYSNELEKNIPLRLELFGFSVTKLFIAKLLANLIYTTFALIIYLIAAYSILDIKLPSTMGAIYYLLIFYFLSTVFLLFAHSIAYAARKFSVTYAFIMTFYFLSLVLSGMMGTLKENLPEIVKTFAKLFIPLYNINDIELYNLFIGKNANIAPLIQSIITFTAITLLISFGAIYYRKKVGQNK